MQNKTNYYISKVILFIQFFYNTFITTFFLHYFSIINFCSSLIFFLSLSFSYKFIAQVYYRCSISHVNERLKRFNKCTCQRDNPHMLQTWSFIAVLVEFEAIPLWFLIMHPITSFPYPLCQAICPRFSLND